MCTLQHAHADVMFVFVCMCVAMQLLAAVKTPEDLNLAIEATKL